MTMRWKLKVRLAKSGFAKLRLLITQLETLLMRFWKMELLRWNQMYPTVSLAFKDSARSHLEWEGMIRQRFGFVGDTGRRRRMLRNVRLGIRKQRARKPAPLRRKKHSVLIKVKELLLRMRMWWGCRKF